MTRAELVTYWVKSSDEDYNTMIHLYEKKDYHWALFVGHLVIEKLLKAYFIKKVNTNVPLIHDLLRLAENSGLELSKEEKLFFATVTTFNIRTRYENYKENFRKLCSKKFTDSWITEIKEYRIWIKKKLVK
jgi:HEPN domain-containing protein